MSDFHELPLHEQYDRLQRLRAVVIALTLGDEELFFRLTGLDIATVQANESPLPDGAALADAAAAWLAGGAA